MARPGHRVWDNLYMYAYKLAMCNVHRDCLGYSSTNNTRYLNPCAIKAYSQFQIYLQTNYHQSFLLILINATTICNWWKMEFIVCVVMHFQKYKWTSHRGVINTIYKHFLAPL